MNRPESESQPTEVDVTRLRLLSLPAMRLAHHELLKRRRTLSAEDLKKAVADFLCYWADVGVLLDTVTDRRDAQSMLDYWVAESYRISRDAPYVTLAEFKPAEAEGLAARAETWYAGLSPDDQAVARRLLLRLGPPSLEDELVRTRLSRTELDPRGAPHQADRLLSQLEGLGLVYRTPAADRGDELFELAHLPLSRYWKRFAEWKQDEEHERRQRQQLRAAAESWKAHGRDPGGLLGGTLLEEARQYTDLNELEQEFVRESRLHEEKLAEKQRRAAQQARARRRWRLAAITGAVLAVILLCLSAYAEIQRREAERQRKEAEEQQKEAERQHTEAEEQRKKAQQEQQLSEALELARAALGQLKVDPELSILLARKAAERAQEVAQSNPARAGQARHRACDALFQALRVSRVERTLSDPKQQAVWKVSFSPTQEDLLATASLDGKLRIWTLGRESKDVSVRELSDEPPDSGGPKKKGLTVVAFSPDGKLLAAASEDGTAKVWDITSGTRKHTFAHGSGPRNEVWGLAFDPGGKFLATGCQDNGVRVWSLESGKLQYERLKDHTDGVLAVAFSSDGTLLASTSQDKTVRLWDARSGKPRSRLRQEHKGVVLGLAFSPETGRTVLATVSEDRTARLWQLPAGAGDEKALALTPPLRGHLDWVRSVSFNRDGTQLATASQDGTAKVWQRIQARGSREEARELFTLRGHHGGVTGVSFSRDGTRLATASFDKTAKVWDARTDRPPLRVPPQEADLGNLYAVAFSKDGKLACGGENGVYVWDSTPGKKPFKLPLPTSPTGDTVTVRGFAFSPDGEFLAAGGDDGKARVWNVSPGKSEPVLLCSHNEAVLGVAFSPDGKFLATASADYTARVWNTATGKEEACLKGHTNRVYAVTFSPKRGYIATAGGDGTVRLWDAATYKPMGDPCPAHTQRVYGVAFSPDGRRLATVGEDRFAKVWEVSDGGTLEPFSPLASHDAAVYGVVFSPSGQRLVTCSADSTVKVWDLSSKWELFTLTDHTAVVRDVALRPDGRRLASVGSGNKALCVYDLAVDEVTLERLLDEAGRRLTRGFTPQEEVRVSLD